MEGKENLRPEFQRIREAFNQFRSQSQGKRRHYPNSLRAMALKARKYGSSTEIAEAIGVSRPTLSIWFRQSPSLKRLKVVSSSSRRVSVPVSAACISVGRRVQISVPVSELSTSLIRSLLEVDTDL